MIQTTELSELLGVSPQRVSTLTKTLNIPDDWSIKKGRARFFNRKAVKEFLKRQNVDYDVRKVIALSNNKGGVGKTGLVLAIALRLRELGFTVNIIDLDPQANLSNFFIDAETDRKILSDIVEKKCSAKDSIIEVDEEFTLLPSSLKNSTLEYLLSNSSENPLETLSPIFRDKNANFTIIDMSPSISKINLFACLASDLVIIPTTLTKDSVDGVEMTYQNIKSAGKSWLRYGFNPDIKYVINGLDSRKSTLFKYVGKLDELGMDSFETMIRTDNVATNFQNKEIENLPASSKFYQDIASIVNEIIGLEIQETATI